MKDGVLIVSESDDLHALLIQDVIKSKGGNCYIIGSDSVHGSELVNYLCVSGAAPQVRLTTTCGTVVDPKEFATLWWRRYKPAQTGLAILGRDEQSLINNDCCAGLRGALETSFEGRWVSHPSATEAASNKLVQLAAAVRAGFNIPATLVTQSPGALGSFADAFDKIIYKPVAGTRGPLVFTRFLDLKCIPEEIIRSAPTIYQEFVPGTRHIRLNAFGAVSHASIIETKQLDWRPNLDVPIKPWAVDDTLQALVDGVLRELSLAMGIFDVKITPDDEYVFLEVNPQGQFLFLEAATGERLADHMANFLLGDDHRNRTVGISPSSSRFAEQTQGVC
ncbi:hypothetical protein ACFOKI_14600 [Sphingomonas qilianensis]|uniref:ATP-grasp domain-containing protein n=1 Tax=Sphingomonas qilianensis TaxID=1736690 RepID=A0ABU9XMJ7_9SPHN